MIVLFFPCYGRVPAGGKEIYVELKYEKRFYILKGIGSYIMFTAGY